MIYMGIDYHKKMSQVTLVAEDGRVVRRARVPNRGEAFERVVAGIDEPISAVFEATRNWTVLDQLLEGVVQERHMAHPLKVRLIAEARSKSDRIDSEVLAHLRRLGFLPESYLRPIEQRRDLEVLRHRLFFVRQQTAVKNRIHALVDRQLAAREQAMTFSDLFEGRGWTWLHQLQLAEPDHSLLRELLQWLGTIREQITHSDGRIAAMWKQDRRIQLVDDYPGIGRFLATLIVCEIGDIHRFRSAKKLCSYTGLIPSTYQSSEVIRHGRLTKQGNKYLRWALIEAVNVMGPNTPLGRVRDRLRATKSANTAKAATARRLLTSISYRLKAYDADASRE
jgi:transposase